MRFHASVFSFFSRNRGDGIGHFAEFSSSKLVTSYNSIKKPIILYKKWLLFSANFGIV